MRITTIGTWGAYPGPAGATSSFLLQSDDQCILLDCGSGVLSALQQHIAPESLTAVLVTHYHADHASDIQCLQYALRIAFELKKRDQALTIFGPDTNSQLKSLSYDSCTAGRAIMPERPLSLGSLKFGFTWNNHQVPCLSMRIENRGRIMAYITDTAWTQNLIGVAQGADLLICEASLYNDQEGTVPGHLTAGQAGELATRAGVNRLVLTHLPHFGDHGKLVEEAEAVYGGPVELARPGSGWMLKPAVDS